ncbi:MAG TPA: thioredoxin TrxC [Spongiibacteraceae bacterium]|nr:thioredoxin TrxC [Spongiibacteraceae bacterium]
MQIVCVNCGVKNRVPDEKLQQHPKCGRCSAVLLPAQPIALDDAGFERFVHGTELPIVVDFWAEWCGPCKMMAPIFAQAAQQRPTIPFVKVDTERALQTASRFQIRSIPTLAVLQGGREIIRSAGAMPLPQLLAWLDRAVAA